MAAGAHAHSHRAAGHRLIPGPFGRFPPKVAGGPGSSLLELPGVSAPGAFRAGVKECLTTEFRSSPGDNTTLPCLRAGIAGGGIRVSMLTDGIRATCQPGDETPRQQHPKAKEPFAIPYQAHSMRGDTGGSSRLRPQSGLRVLSCRSRSAAEAQGFDLGCLACAPTAGRSGWKPRALQPSGNPGWLPLSGGLVVPKAHACSWVADVGTSGPVHPSAARAFSRPVTAKASSKTRLRPRLKRPATLQSRRHAAGPSFWPAFDLLPGSAPSRGPGVARHCVAGAVQATVKQGRGSRPRPLPTA